MSQIRKEMPREGNWDSDRFLQNEEVGPGVSRAAIKSALGTPTSYIYVLVTSFMI